MCEPTVHSVDVPPPVEIIIITTFFFPVMHTLFTAIYSNRSNAYKLTDQTNKTAHSAEAVRKTVIGGREAIGARGEQKRQKHIARGTAEITV